MCRGGVLECVCGGGCLGVFGLGVCVGGGGLRVCVCVWGRGRGEGGVLEYMCVCVGGVYWSVYVGVGMVLECVCVGWVGGWGS